MQGAILKNWNFCKQIEVLYRSEKYNQAKKKPECQQILWIIFPMDKSNQRQMLQFYDVKNANYPENIFLKAP